MQVYRDTIKQDVLAQMRLEAGRGAAWDMEVGQ